MKTLTASVAILAMMLAAPALASSDGTLGPTSTGSFTVNATVSQPTTDNVQVFGLDDFSLSPEQGSVPGEAGTFDSKTFCIIRSPSGGNVSIQILSFDPADTSYVVKTPGGGNQIELSLHITNNSEGMVYQPVYPLPVSDVPVSSTCNDVAGDPTALELSVVTAGEVTGAPGIYSGAFLITVGPQ